MGPGSDYLISGSWNCNSWWRLDIKWYNFQCRVWSLTSDWWVKLSWVLGSLHVWVSWVLGSLHVWVEFTGLLSQIMLLITLMGRMMIMMRMMRMMRMMKVMTESVREHDARLWRRGMVRCDRRKMQLVIAWFWSQIMHWSFVIKILISLNLNDGHYLKPKLQPHSIPWFRQLMEMVGGEAELRAGSLLTLIPGPLSRWLVLAGWTLQWETQQHTTLWYDRVTQSGEFSDSLATTVNCH